MPAGTILGGRHALSITSLQNQPHRWKLLAPGQDEGDDAEFDENGATAQTKGDGDEHDDSAIGPHRPVLPLTCPGKRGSLNVAYKLLLAEARRGDAGGAGGEGGGRGSRGLRDRRRRDGTGVRGLTTRDEPNNTQHVPAKRGYGGEGGGIVNGWIGETLLRVHKKQRVELAAGSHAQAGVQPLTPPHAHTPRKQLKQRGVGSPRAFRFSRPPFVSRGEGVGGGVGVGARSPPRMQVDQTMMGDVELASGVARVDWQPRTQGELQGIHMGMDTPQYAFWTGAGRSASTPAPPPVGPPSSSQPQSTFARPSVPTTVALLPFSTPHRRAVPGAVPSADSHGWRAEGPDRDRASPVPYFAAPHPTTVGAQTTRALQTQLAPRTPLARQQVMPSASVAVSPGAGFWASGGAGGTTALGRNLSIIPEDDGARESEAVAMAGGRAGHGYEHGPGQGRGQGTDGDAFGAAFWKRRRMECGSAVRTWEAGERDTLAREPVHGRNDKADHRQDRHHQDPALLSPQASPVLDVHALEIVAAAAAANEIEDVARSVSSMSVSLPGSGSAMSQDSFSGKRGAEQMPGRGYRKMTQRVMSIEQDQTPQRKNEKNSSQDKEKKSAPIGSYCPVITGLPRVEQSVSLSDVDMESIRSFGERQEASRSQESINGGRANKAPPSIPSVPALTWATTSEAAASASEHSPVRKAATPVKDTQVQFPEHQSSGFIIWMDEE